MHRLVQAVIVDSMDRETQRMWAERVVKAVGSQLLADAAREQSSQRYARQAQTAERPVEHWNFTFLEAVHTLWAVGRYLYGDGYYSRAETLCFKALSMLPTTPGASTTDTYQCLLTLVAIKTDNRDLHGAEAVCQTFLAESERAFGPKALQTAFGLYCLAHISIKRDKHDQAEPLLMRALAIYRATPSQPLPAVADALVDLAQIRSHQDRRTEAEALYQEALMLNEQVYGSKHPKVADVLQNWQYTMPLTRNQERLRNTANERRRCTPHLVHPTTRISPSPSRACPSTLLPGNAMPKRTTITSRQ